MVACRQGLLGPGFAKRRGGGVKRKEEDEAKMRRRRRPKRRDQKGETKGAKVCKRRER